MDLRIRLSPCPSVVDRVGINCFKSWGANLTNENLPINRPYSYATIYGFIMQVNVVKTAVRTPRSIHRTSSDMTSAQKTKQYLFSLQLTYLTF